MLGSAMPQGDPVFFSGTLHLAMTQHPRETAEIVGALSRPIRDGDDLVEVLQVVVDLAVRSIAAADHASVTVAHSGTAFTAAHTDEQTLAVDRRQYERDDGPCLEAARTGTVVLAHVGVDDSRWSHFAADARGAGVGSVLAAPIASQDQAIGALNLYSTTEPQLEARDEVLLTVLAELAGRLVHDLLAVRTAQTLAAQLHEAMANRAPIEQAKGILMAVHRVDDPAAFAMLRAESQRSNVKLRTVAESFVHQYSQQAPAVVD